MDAIVVTDHDKSSIAPEADRHQGIIIVIEQHRIDILYTTVEKSATVPAVRTQAWETSIPVDIDNDRRSMMPAAILGKLLWEVRRLSEVQAFWIMYFLLQICYQH